MGIVHFAGLGKSPGAVTAGLSCIVHRYGKHHDQYGDMAERLVIFTSPEIANGTELSFRAEHNEYGSLTTSKTWPRSRTNARDIVVRYMHEVFPNTKVHLVTVDVNDFDACFNAVAGATLKLHEPGHVGKHIWANITGGSNLLNAAIVQTAYLSGVIARLYYTFVANLPQHGRYLQCFSHKEQEFRYGEIYTPKTSFDQRHKTVLEVLEQLGPLGPDGYIRSKDLLDHVKSSADTEFRDVDLQSFRRDFLNIMRGIEQTGDRVVGQEDFVRLGADGQELLDLMRKPLFRALINYERLSEEERQSAIADLNIEKLEKLT